MSHKACGYGIDNVWFCTEGAAERGAACKPCTLTTCPQYGTTHGHAPDMVDHPDHYKSGKMEVIDVIEAFELGFCLGNTTKYVLRAGKKDRKKEVEDLRKARWYLDRHIASLEAKR